MKRFASIKPLAVALAAAACLSAAHAEKVRVAVIDPLSGPFAALGENQLKSWQYVADIATWSKLDGKGVQIEQEGTGMGWKTDAVIPASAAQQPTSCQMQRPAR